MTSSADSANGGSTSSTGASASSASSAATGNSAAVPSLTDVVVIGGGVAGLLSALESAKRGLSVVLFESRDTLGGFVAARTLDAKTAAPTPLTVDVGAESFATRGGHVEKLVRELGLGDDILAPNPNGAWVQLATGAHPLPKNALLGIPAVPLADDVRAILGWSGSLRAQLDRLMPLLRVRPETDLGDIVRRRMGQKVVDRLVTPVVAGVHSASPSNVDVHAVAPGLTSAMTSQGSLSGAVMAMLEDRKDAAKKLAAEQAKHAAQGASQGAEKTRTAANEAPGETGAPLAPGSAVLGIRGGMSRLVDALVEQCRYYGVELHLGTSVDTLKNLAESADDEMAAHSNSAAWSIRYRSATSEGHIRARGVVIATSFWQGLELATEAGIDTGDQASWPAESSVEVVSLLINQPELNSNPRGTGVLVAADVPTVKAKALTHSTSKWSWLRDELPAGQHVVRLSYNVDSDDPAPHISPSRALADASILLGVPLSESELLDSAVTRWNNGLAFATVGHRARVASIVQQAEALPSLEIVGAWVAGTGLAAVVPQVRENVRDFALTLALPTS